MPATPAPFALFERSALLPLHEGGRRLPCALSMVAAPLAVLEGVAPDTLSPEEADLLTDGFAPARRQSFLAGRRAAKNALGFLAPESSAREIRILPGLLQQPVVHVPGRSNLQVTLAHAGMAAFAIAHPEACPMGVDLERAAPDQLSALRAQTTPREWALARSALPGDDAGRLLQLWCLKEALSKALRCGLTMPFSLLEARTLTALPGGVRARFENFAQYEGIALHAAPFCLAVVQPHTARWESLEGGMPPHPLREWLGEIAALG
ncbi:4'-phosphopantetheinyl transferase family protein [Ancylobacter sp.]|uniref:4'-phosphopantetheinyl transferase family protein n=1 Tax=Ancylobacter sp. TaxID=1872567 RepID=UPI003D0CAAB8